MKATHDELEKIDRLIDLAFDEDIAQGDLTTESIFPDVTEATALLTANEYSTSVGATRYNSS